jgi:hypothetical protein
VVCSLPASYLDSIFARQNATVLTAGSTKKDDA